MPTKEKSVISIETEVIDVDKEDNQEPHLKEIGPQVLGSLPTPATTKAAKGASGIRKAKEIEGREEGKKVRPHSFHSAGASHDGSEHGGMCIFYRIQHNLNTG